MSAKELMEHAMVAYVMYTELRMVQNAEEMRCLVGISTGLYFVSPTLRLG